MEDVAFAAKAELGKLSLGFVSLSLGASSVVKEPFQPYFDVQPKCITCYDVEAALRVSCPGRTLLAPGGLCFTDRKGGSTVRAHGEGVLSLPSPGSGEGAHSRHQPLHQSPSCTSETS